MIIWLDLLNFKYRVTIKGVNKSQRVQSVGDRNFQSDIATPRDHNIEIIEI